MCLWRFLVDLPLLRLVRINISRSTRFGCEPLLHLVANLIRSVFRVDFITVIFLVYHDLGMVHLFCSTAWMISYYLQNYIYCMGVLLCSLGVYASSFWYSLPFPICAWFILLLDGLVALICLYVWMSWVLRMFVDQFSSLVVWAQSWLYCNIWDGWLS